MKNFNENNIIIYQSQDGVTKIDVLLENETVWLTQAQIVDLYQSSKSNISEHIKHIFEDDELDELSTVRKFRTVQIEGNREVKREVKHYNLELIIAVGFRVKSNVGTHFRKWATERLKEYMIKGFTMDDERLKGNYGGNYWKELLNRIRDIRSSEKMIYRQVLDLYATCVDYNPKDETSIEFFKVVQNKLHYAAHGHTAAEIIYERSDSTKPFMGLTNFPGDFPTKNDITIAKNYLTEDELKNLNLLVSGYFDLAERNAINHKHMYMKDYLNHLNETLKSQGDRVLEGSGKISHKQATTKALQEYSKYQIETLSPVEEEYLKTVKEIENKTKKK